MTIHDAIAEVEYEAHHGELFVLSTWALTIHEYLSTSCETNQELTFVLDGLNVLIYCGVNNIPLPRDIILEIWDKIHISIQEKVKDIEMIPNT